MCAFHLAFQLPLLPLLPLLLLLLLLLPPLLLLLLLLLLPPTGDLGTTCYTSHRMLWRR